MRGQGSVRENNVIFWEVKCVPLSMGTDANTRPPIMAMPRDNPLIALWNWVPVVRSGDGMDGDHLPAFWEALDLVVVFFFAGASFHK